MQQYILRRLLYSIPSLLVVSILIAGLVRLQPGDVVMAMVAEGGNMDPALLDQIREQLGLDKPFPIQYATWMVGLLTLNPGDSYWSGKPIIELWSQSIPVTLQLGAMAVFISVVFSIPIGVLTAMRQDSGVDHVGRVFAISGLSLPDFWLATLVITYLGLWFHWMPSIIYISPLEDPWGNFQLFMVPALIMGFRLSASSMRMTRSTMLEVLREDYIRTAWAKGLRERVVVMRHALKNALIPVITILGNELRIVLGGTVVMEVIFGLPGLGRMTYSAILARDYLVVQSNIMFIAVVVVLLNLLVDLTYGLLDPRIHYR